MVGKNQVKADQRLALVTWPAGVQGKGTEGKGIDSHGAKDLETHKLPATSCQKGTAGAEAV